MTGDSLRLAGQKVLLATHISFWERTRGAHQRIHQLIDYLVQSGAEVTVFYTGPVNQLPTSPPSHYRLLTPAELLPADSTLLLLILRIKGWLEHLLQVMSSFLSPAEKLPDKVRGWKDFISEQDR